VLLKDRAHLLSPHQT